MSGRIFYGCPNCLEPKTTLKNGKHVFISTTAINFGAKCQVVINCSICGYVEDITNDTKQVSKDEIDKLLAGSH